MSLMVKPFSMALLGWLFIRGVFADYLPADQLDAYIAGLILLAAAAMAIAPSGCRTASQEREADHFIDSHVAQVAPLWTQANLTYWDATTTGKPEAWEKLKELQLAMRAIYSDRAEFERIKVFRNGGPGYWPHPARDGGECLDHRRLTRLCRSNGSKRLD